MNPSRVAGGQMIGGRERQEDEYGIHDFGAAAKGRDRILMVLADGMGGHAGGAEASHCAIAQFLDDADRRDTCLHDRLAPALQAANRSLAELKRHDPALQDAGCTLVAAAIENGRLTWISVGDSALLLCRDGVIHRLNEDHSMRPVLAELVDAGRMTAETARVNPNRNSLRSVLSGEKTAMIDEGLTGVRLRPGDQILLASDGLDALSHADVARILMDGVADRLDKVIDRLLGAVSRVQARHQDNTTVTLYRPQLKPRPNWRRRLLRLAILLIFASAAVVSALVLRPHPAPKFSRHAAVTISKPAAAPVHAAVSKSAPKKPSTSADTGAANRKAPPIPQAKPSRASGTPHKKGR